MSQSSHEINELLKSPPGNKDRDSDTKQEFDPNFQERIDQLKKDLEEQRNEEINYQINYRKSRSENAKLRDRIEEEFTEPVLKDMFRNNLEYLQVKQMICQMHKAFQPQQ